MPIYCCFVFLFCLSCFFINLAQFFFIRPINNLDKQFEHYRLRTLIIVHHPLSLNMVLVLTPKIGKNKNPKIVHSLLYRINCNYHNISIIPTCTKIPVNFSLNCSREVPNLICSYIFLVFTNLIDVEKHLFFNSKTI